MTGNTSRLIWNRFGRCKGVD